MPTRGSNASDFSILVVDDDAELRDSLTEELRSFDFKTYSAESVGDALLVLYGNRVDIILSDVRMPQVSGLDFLKMVDPFNPGGPKVVLMTGSKDVTFEQAAKFGASMLLHKPLDRHFLLDSLWKVLIPKAS